MKLTELEKSEIQEKYLPWKIAIRLLGKLDPQAPVSSGYRKRLVAFNHFFKFSTLEEAYYFEEFDEKTSYVVSKNDVYSFITNYISREDGFKLQNTYSRYDTLEKYLVKNNVEIVRISTKHSLTFYHRESFNNFILNKLSREEDFKKTLLNSMKREGLYYQAEILKKFNISEKSWLNVLSNAKLDFSYEGTIKYFSKNDVDELFRSYQQEIEDLYENHYSPSYIEQELNIKNHRALSVALLEPVRVPKYLSPFLQLKDKKYCYRKNDVHNYLKTKQFYEVTMTNPYEAYEYKLNVLELSFPGHLNETQRLWETFVRDFLRTRKQNPKKIENTVGEVVKAASFIINLPKEIFQLSSKEINLSLFNSYVGKNIQRLLYYFVRDVYSYFEEVQKKRIYNLHNIDSKYKIRNKTNREKEIYSLNDYKAFHSYANKISLHKHKAIQDVYKHFKTPQKCVRYDSAWLYVLIHLNNGWRHSDVIYNVPRINLEGTKIKSLAWLLENQISKEDVDHILLQMKRKVSLTNHHKNGAERFFFCSEDLSISLATALAISELRTRNTNSTADYLVDFKTKNQAFSYAPYDAFFEEFDSTIKFESLKMNRTLLSYIFSVIKQTNPEEALSTAQHLRGHMDIETTNIYVTIPQTQVDFLVAQLFDRDNFGYIPYILTDILIGKNKDNSLIKTQQVQALKSNFGDIYKIEEFAGFLNDVINERMSVEIALKDTKHEELKSLNHQLLTKQLPSKQENFQCLVSMSGCEFPELTDCANCPLSIPNYYSLSSITQRIKERMITLVNDFPEFEFYTEKVRFAKMFNRDMMLLKDAIEKFGKDEVFKIMDLKVEEYRSLLKSIPSLKKYIENGVE